MEGERERRRKEGNKKETREIRREGMEGARGIRVRDTGLCYN